MIIRGVLCATVEEQIAGGDDSPIDPAALVAACEREPGRTFPLTINFDAKHIVGRATRVWLEDGRAMVEAVIASDFPPDLLLPQFAAGTVGEGDDPTSHVLKSVGLTADNTNANQPSWSIAKP